MTDESGDKQQIYRLVADVASLKSDSHSQADSLRQVWQKMDAVQTTLQEISRKLDFVAGQDERLKEVEEGVANYRSIKAKALAWVAGIGMGTGFAGASLIDTVKNWWNGV